MADKNKLTIKQEKFAQGLFAGLTQREAYKQAYDAGNMTDKSVDEKACELANNVKIKSRIDELTNELQLRNMVTVERILSEYAKLGFFDPRNLFRADGSPKDISELDDDTAAALAGLDVQEVYEGSGDQREFVGYVKKYKLADKKTALDSMAKHLGMFVEKTESKVTTTNLNYDVAADATVTDAYTKAIRWLVEVGGMSEAEAKAKVAERYKDLHLQ